MVLLSNLRRLSSHMFGANVVERNEFNECFDRWLACLAPDCLDTEWSVFMQRLRVQGAAGEPGLA